MPWMAHGNQLRSTLHTKFFECISLITRLRPDWEVTVLPESVEDAIAWFKIQPHPNILFLDIKLSSACSAYFNGKIILHVKPPHKDKITVSEEKVSSFKLWLNF